MEAEKIANDRGNHFVCRNRSVAADRMAAHGKSALGPDIGLVLSARSQLMLNAKDEETWLFRGAHVIDDRHEIPRADVATAQTG